MGGAGTSAVKQVIKSSPEIELSAKGSSKGSTATPPFKRRSFNLLSTSVLLNNNMKVSFETFITSSQLVTVMAGSAVEL